ncbi:MAG TPA: hypothetical protein VNU45_06760 [Rummeliibacillus sp.]|nr:hypothetical protein [Rummeliibacillus sp.]
MKKSLFLSLLGVILLITGQYLGNVNGEMTNSRIIVTYIALILGLISFIGSFITGFIGIKNKENSTALKYSGVFISSIFTVGSLILIVLFSVAAF